MNPPENTAPDDIQLHLHQVQELLTQSKIVDELAQQNQTHHLPVENTIHNQNQQALRTRLDLLHSADIAYILEALPLEDRLYVWGLIGSDRDGDVLLEVSDAVRDSLIETMDPHELKAAAEYLDTDELADLAPDLPPEVFLDVFQSLNHEEREKLRAAMSYPEDSVGALMDFDLVSVREDVTLETVLRYLRRFDELPDHTDKLFVVDREQKLRGILTLESLLIHDPEKEVAEIMRSEPIFSFVPEDKADEAAAAFDRYDLVSAPVIDAESRVIGRLTVVDMVEYIRGESEQEILNQAGLREEEDIFASVWDSIKNRWAWLAVNMVTAIIASRVIGLFEGSIEKLVALATLMPIVAGIGGNSGNQTITMIVRAIAMGQVNPSALKRLLRKETSVALINGVVWGGLLGLMSWILYDNYSLGIVMTVAMTLNLLLAACAGVLIPMIRFKMDKDPALGSSVLITALTDSGGFFIFLGLATLFLM